MKSEEEKKQIQKKIQAKYRKDIYKKRKVEQSTKRDIFIGTIIVFLFVLISIIMGPGL
ncbi:hypothetical protein [Viridibacillus arvi]|uniref:hypothetical protein n=1 Tax=Viridibacillus arvi TaxID=263475 RepID=UPI0034CE9901